MDDPGDRKMKARSKGLQPFIVLGCLFCLSHVPAVYALDHSGVCSGTFLAADNPHNLTADCDVPAGQTLTLEAGVILDIEGNSTGIELDVFGTLNSQGTKGYAGTAPNAATCWGG